MTHDGSAGVRHPLVLLVLGVALVSVLSLGGAVPHLHVGHDPALFNEEHDLTLLLGSGAHAALPDAPPVIALAAVVADAPDVSLSRPAVFHRRLADPRAPPLA